MVQGCGFTYRKQYEMLLSKEENPLLSLHRLVDVVRKVAKLDEMAQSFVALRPLA